MAQQAGLAARLVRSGRRLEVSTASKQSLVPSALPDDGQRRQDILLPPSFLHGPEIHLSCPVVALFQRYIGIDYSGAQTPADSLPGLRIYQATALRAPEEVPPPPSPRKYWTRREIAEWLVEQLSPAGAERTLVGIDHGFSFPLKYFQRYNLPLRWPEFLADFQKYWPTHEQIYVCFVRDGIRGDASARCGDPRWRRLTEVRAGRAKSVFHFDVPGSVAASTHAGLPWLLYLRNHLGGRLHCWPFDGWDIPTHSSAIAEVYPALWNKTLPQENRTRDQHDAFPIAARLRQFDSDGTLPRLLSPQLSPVDRATAEIEGWILGVEGTVDLPMPRRIM